MKNVKFSSRNQSDLVVFFCEFHVLLNTSVQNISKFIIYISGDGINELSGGTRDLLISIIITAELGAWMSRWTAEMNTMNMDYNEYGF